MKTVTRAHGLTAIHSPACIFLYCLHSNLSIALSLQKKPACISFLISFLNCVPCFGSGYQIRESDQMFKHGAMHRKLNIKIETCAESRKNMSKLQNRVIGLTFIIFPVPFIHLWSGIRLGNVLHGFCKQSMSRKCLCKAFCSVRPFTWPIASYTVPSLQSLSYYEQLCSGSLIFMQAQCSALTKVIRTTTRKITHDA